MTSDDRTTTTDRNEKIAKLEQARSLLIESITLIDREIAKERGERPVIPLD